MDHRSEVRDFLVSRRARLSPTAAGLTPDGRRRVPGLRRGEVAGLAGVSVEYYTRLERGDLAGVSSGVLDAVARALQLDDAERRHLDHLARAHGNGPRRARRRASPITPALQATVDAVTGGAAFVRTGRMDILAANLLARAIYADLFTAGAPQPPNIARFAFLDERSRDFYPDWERAADDIVAILRAEAGRVPDDPDLAALIGILATRSPAFATRWGAHDVQQHSSGVKHFRHPLVGDLHLDYQALEPADSAGLLLLVYTPHPDSGTAEALRLLASWEATDPVDRASPAPHPAH